MIIQKLNIFLLFFVIILLQFGFAQGQIVITTDELPSEIGLSQTFTYDTTENALVDVGSSGPNQTWSFMQDMSGIEIGTEVVELNSTSFAADFPNSNWVIKYNGGLLDLIYSDIFPQIEGDVYFYQQVTQNEVNILGTGFVSSYISGAAIFEPPNVILEFIPTQYLDEWTTKSIFTITKDTTILETQYELKLTVNDSAYSVIDAWGTITVPMGTFECLRMKSYVTFDEKVYLDNNVIKQKLARVINYNWIVEDLGLLVRITSHTGEQDDNFTDARLFTRMKQSIFLPVELIGFRLDVNDNQVHLNWKTASEKNNYGFVVERKYRNENFIQIAFVKGYGTTSEYQNYEYADKNLKPGNYQYRLKQIDNNGQFEYSNVINAVISNPETFELSQNYPNPFYVNGSGLTGKNGTEFQITLPEKGHVTVKIYNILGAEVKEISNKVVGAGTYRYTWNGSNNSGLPVAAGIYIYKMEYTKLSDKNGLPSIVKYRKMLLAR